MDSAQAVCVLGALAHEHRLRVFRALVEAGKDGMAAGAIAERLNLPGSSLSFHLGQLREAGLIAHERQHRSLIYRAEYSTTNELIAFLMQNCCNGNQSCGDPPICKDEEYVS